MKTFITVVTSKLLGRFDFDTMFSLEMYEKIVAFGRLGVGKYISVRIPIPHIARTQDPYSYETFEAVCDWVFQIVWYPDTSSGKRWCEEGYEWRVMNFIREGSEVRDRRSLECLY